MSYNFSKTKKTLRKYLDRDRFEHSEGVMYTAAALAMRYGEDLEKAQIAGILHDCAKCMPDGKKLKICEKNHIEITEAEKMSPFLLHAKVGAYIAKAKYDIEDTEILDAIACHTTGKPAMTLLEKIIYISDYIEPMRNKASNLEEVRKMAFVDLDEALFKILSDTLVYLEKSSKKMDPMTMQTYEYYRAQIESAQ